MENKKILDKIVTLDDFYSLVDYEEFNKVNTCLVLNINNSNINGSNSIRVNFNIGNQFKEIIVKKSIAKRVFNFIKIIYNNLTMNILDKNSEECFAQDILKKINKNFGIKGFIGIHLKILEFPLIYYLITFEIKKLYFRRK